MDHSNIPAEFHSFMEQITKSLQATVSLTQSVQSLQSEVRRQGSLISSSNSDTIILRDKVQALMNLVQGEGMGDSIYKNLIQLDLRVKNLENQVEEDEEEQKESKRLRFPWQIALWTITAAFLTMIANIVLSPIFNKLFK